jgi:uncharacterized protein (TIGR03435 family)
MIPTDLSPVWNHLWQSTLCVAAVWLLTLALRKNRAAVRYWLWFAASLKFLVPFSLLVSAASQLEWRTTPMNAPPAIAFAVEHVSQPFALPVFTPAPAQSNPIPAILLVLWLTGVAIGIGFWLRWWRSIETARRAAQPLSLRLPIPVMASPGRLEPGVFGILKPVLLLPDGIAHRLNPEQLKAIIAHELCHIRRRDNLTAAIHMAVETVFWFHPLIWWIRIRLVEERERACDEDVLRQADRHVYAEGILNVCKFYLESPMVCASGVTGADLKKRIEKILTSHIARSLDWRRKVLLVAAGLAALAWPLAVGIMNAPAGHAQSADSPPLKFEVTSVKRNKSGSQRSPSMIHPGGRFSATNNTVRALILNAYEIPPYLLSGGPSWIDSEAYDVDAKPADGTIPPGVHGRPLWEKTRAMIRALLADRFHLEIRRESKEMPLYEISVAKNGPKLTKSTRDCSADEFACHGFSGNPRRLSAMGVDMWDLAYELSYREGRPVLDKTGISGVFDFLLQWNVFYGRQRPAAPHSDETPRAPSRDEGPMPDSESLPDLATALDQQLGLKLESRKGPVETYVIVKVERPADN